MDKLLKLLGFNEREILQFKKEINQLSLIMGLNEQQCNAAAEKLPAHFNLSFDSLRRLLKFLFETIFLDLREQTEKKHSITIIQTAVPMPVAVAATINELNPEIRITSSEYLIIYLSGLLFDVFANLCSPGEHTCGRCGLNLSREKLYRDPHYPKPDKIISCLGYCDEIYKTGETLSVLHGVEHIHLKGLNGLDYYSQKEYLNLGLKSFIMEQAGGVEREVEACLGRCNDRMLEISLLLNKINRLAAADKDVFITFNEISLLNLFHLIYLPNHFEKGKEILNSFIRELQERRQRREYVLKNPFRIGCMHLPFTNPFVDRCFLENGAAVIVSSFYEAAGEVKGPEDEFDRCIRAFYGNRALGDIKAKAENVDRIIDEYKLDAFLFGQFENDRALGGDQLLIMKKLKNNNKSHFVAMNNWAVMGEWQRTRLESLTELMLERKELS